MTHLESPPGFDRRRFLQGIGLAAAALALPHRQSQAEEASGVAAFSVAAPTAVPPLAVIALNRMGFGPRPGDIAAFNALGATDDARLSAYIDQQLNPGSITDTEYETRLADAAFTTLDKTLEQLWYDHVLNNGGDYTYRTMPMRDTERVTFLRALYSQKQLVEVLADFWHNHFNVYGWHYNVAPVFVHYDRDVIRAHLLGNFRAMVEAVAKSPAMLYYLDNFTNEAGGPNENYARELFELHALGAENYLGVMSQDDVPVDGEGRPIGYVDEDVYEATRCFTGWTVNDSRYANTGVFHYDHSHHDRFQKRVLSTTINIPHDQGPQVDGKDVLDLLAFHPGTARYICRKLCRRLISDNPPNSLVQAAADVFQAQKDAPDQLRQVVSFILHSEAFKTTWGAKIKRPFEAVVSAMRAGDADFTIKHGDADSDSFMYYYGQTGQSLFRWPAPNGYADVQEAWQSTTPLIMRWRLVNWLVDQQDDANNYRLDVLGQTPVNVRSANELADFWIARVLGRPMMATDREQIVLFMAQGTNPDIPLPLDTSSSVQSRLRSMVGLIMLSPEFQWR